MVKALVIASIVWPLVLAASVWQRASDGPTTWTAIVHGIGSRICHQRPERSFHTAGAQWPVCGRCSGLYLAVPLGALLALSPRALYLHTLAAPGAMSALDDQHLGGAIMLMTGGLSYLLGGLWLTAGLVRRRVTA